MKKVIPKEPSLEAYKFNSFLQNYNRTSGSMFDLLPLLVVFIIMQTRIFSRIIRDESRIWRRLPDVALQRFSEIHTNANLLLTHRHNPNVYVM